MKPLLNVYYDAGDLILVSRDEEGRPATERVAADRCFFLRRGGMPGWLAREVKSGDDLGRHVSGVREEGEWLRVSWLPDVRATVVVSHLKRLAAAGVQTYEGTVPPHRRWIVEHGAKVARPRRVYVDIETDSRATFNDAVAGRAMVLCFAMVDERGRSATAVLQDDRDSSEQALLRKFWRWVARFDQVVSWSGKNFDFPVLVERSRALGIDVDDEKRRLLWLDHLVVFEKANVMAAASGAEKQSLKLNDIAEELGIAGKHDFDAGRTWQAWSNAVDCGGAPPCMRCMRCRGCLVRYNLQDTRLMPAIEAGTGYLELLQTICETCGVFADTGRIDGRRQWGKVQETGAAGQNGRTESLMLRIARERGYKFPTRFPSRGEKYAGAFVMKPTKAGILRDVHVADFSGMYPNIIISWNMSQESKVRPGSKPDAFFCSEAAYTGTRFDTRVDAILPHAVSEMIRLRKHSKDMQAGCAPGTDEAKHWERLSTAYKIAANAIYGVTGLPVSRLFDREVAEAVTQCGSWLIQETVKAAEVRGIECVYVDTDGGYFVGVGRDEFQAFVRWCNEDLFPRLLEARGCRRNTIEIAFEKSYARLVFVTAKRYAGSYSHYKGTVATAESKPEIKGLEYKRGDATKLARDLQEEVVHRVVGYKCEPVDDPALLVEVADRWRRRILEDELSLADVKKSKTLGAPIDAYGVDEDGNRKLKKDGTPVSRGDHVEVAAILAERGREVRPGVRIDYVCVDGSSSPKRMIPAEDFDGRFDRHTLWEDFVWPPTMRFLEAAYPDYDWSPWKKTRPPKPRKPRAKRARERVVHGEALPGGKDCGVDGGAERGRPEGGREVQGGGAADQGQVAAT